MGKVVSNVLYQIILAHCESVHRIFTFQLQVLLVMVTCICYIKQLLVMCVYIWVAILISISTGVPAEPVCNWSKQHSSIL